ncbi:molecular chaperone [Enterovibrio nigricans]|uniref:P pilus assembly protein, chaperone PapD n=1 Tax=Enterovibrio nigricans DSM 22720 TaxID=1121868 RepID=A0A1T4UFM3_9GAMM|nr:molecular chaperone [Enterovibrio nigricans]SKA51565.1 P pilus assembly protein, chaperone PapD [Enterovibrio nigricans DSM 22720]
MNMLFSWSVLLMGLLFSWVSHAYQVKPMIAEMTPLGRGAQMSMRIDNTNDFPLTVELIPLKLSMDRAGIETLDAADDDLLVIPVTAVIAPGKSQSVLVRYIGDPEIKQSKAYRISVRQQNVLRDEDQDLDIGLLMRFDTLMNVKPENVSSNLSVKSLKKDKQNWLVEVENTGDSYGRINEVIWTLKEGGKTMVLRGADISKYIAATLVLPHSSRVFSMKPIKGFSPNKTSVEISNLN